MSALATQTIAKTVRTGSTPAHLAPILHKFGVEPTLQKARRCLLSLQNPDGHWRGELQGDTILESEYILLMAFLGRAGESKVHKAAAYLVQQQRPDGAWANHPGGPVDLNVSVKAYFALKLTGHPADAGYMVRARELIRQGGGAEACNSYTKFYLALLGQFPYENCAAVPPEMIFLPKWMYFNIYAMSAWTRTIIIPLSLFYAHKPMRKVPSEEGVAELFLDDPHTPRWPHPPTKRLLTWTNFFLAADWIIKFLEVWGPQFIRKKAIERAAEWMLDHFQDSDGVGAIFPPIIYTIISLHCLGHGADSPEMQYALKQLDDLMLEEADTLRVQPCFSPVWDTALSVNALAMAGAHPHDPAITHAARWLIEREVRRPGDWSLMNPGAEPAGWFFEYNNGFYPDIDDTAMVLMGLARSGKAWHSTALAPSRSQMASREGDATSADPLQDDNLIPAVRRGLNWLLQMQNQDGGWAAFDRDINHEILTKVPFADHNAMLDPSCPDITARVLEALGQYGMGVGHSQVDRGLEFIAKTQDPRGCWIGRWGVNYIYGTWQVLIGLEAAGFDMTQPMVRRAVAWLKSAQQPSGGWGETCQSYNDPSLAGQGTVTASQTAWALLGLIAAGEADSDSVHRGIQSLIASQQPDGNWEEDQFTGTGFPKVFYLKYHMYRLYFPLMALARYKNAMARARSSGEEEASIGYDWPAVLPMAK
ncbi:MAG: terpene cyclase/mutase family protein [Planctomycetes bacterium]|nr:terpene cyclase/mutase family protein [Planctomycetota bacterium]